MFSDSALPVLNGVSISIDLLIRHLRAQGHSVHLFTASHFRHRDADPNILRFPAIETPWTRDYPLALPPFTGMLRKFRKHEFDVIHTHTPFTIGFVGLRWAESHEIPVVATYHTLYDKYAHYIPFFPKRYTRYKIAKHTNFYYNKVDRVITPSDAAKRWLLRHSVRTPITVIPTGIEQPAREGRHEARQRLGIAADEKILLYVGRVAKEKNMDTLIDAAAILCKLNAAARLLVVGDGPYRVACIERVRAAGIGNQVRFVGYIPRSQVDLYYEASDIFVFASQTETQGLVIGEAMTFGLPSVVVAGGGAGSAIVDGENGFLVRNDAEVFAFAAQCILSDDSLYARLSAAARISSLEFSCDSMSRRVVEVYRSAMTHSEKSLESRFAAV